MLPRIYLTFIVIAVNTVEYLDASHDSPNINSEAADTSSANKYVRSCEPDACKGFAKMLTEYMNDTVDPCENFYEYTCGKWGEMHPDIDNYNIFNVDRKFHFTIRQEFDDILGSGPLSDISSLQNAQKWYRACMDVDSRESRGLEPIVTKLDEIGGWPLISQSNGDEKEKYNWMEVDDYYAHLTGMNGFYTITVTIDKKLDENYIVLSTPDIVAGGFMLNDDIDEIELSDEAAATIQIPKDGLYWKFADKMVEMITEFKKLDIDKVKLYDDLEEMLRFQYNLQQIIRKSHTHKYENITLNNFQKLYDSNVTTENSQINWVSKISNAFKEAGVEIDTTNTQIIVEFPLYFQKLANLLDTTSTRTIVNFLHWKFVCSVTSATTLEMRRLYNNLIEYWNPKKGNYTRNERYYYCLNEVDLRHVVLYAYETKYLPDKTIDIVRQIVEDIYEQFENEIENSTWLDDKLKPYVLDKFKRVKLGIGYPTWYRNVRIINQLYDGLHFGATHFENSLFYRKYKKLKELRTFVKKNEYEPNWPVSIVHILTTYFPRSHTVIVPAVYFQHPYFNISQPNALNYGMLGDIISNKLAHMYDTLFDFSQHDSLKNRKLCSPAMMEASSNISRCFEQQFDKYRYYLPENKTIKNYGNMTKIENIIDTMGAHIVYEAFKKRQEKNGGSDEVLPDLKMFNGDQLFFLSFARMFCWKAKPEFLTHWIKLEDHSVDPLRVIGTLSNMKEFAEAFNCPVGTPMNRAQFTSIVPPILQSF